MEGETENSHHGSTRGRRGNPAGGREASAGGNRPDSVGPDSESHRIGDDFGRDWLFHSLDPQSRKGRAIHGKKSAL